MFFTLTRYKAGRLPVSFLICSFLLFSTNASAVDCCYPPDNISYDCNDLPYGFDPYDLNALKSLFGSPTKKCSGYSWRELTPDVQLNSCEIGTIIRKFEVYNSSGKKETCTQEVTLLGVHDYQIYFPKDASAYCQAPEPENLIEQENACDLLSVSKTDAMFSTGSSGCYKILRTYKVINWCEYDGESPVVSIGRDEDCDGVQGDEGVWVIRRKNGTVFLDRDTDIYNYVPSAAENLCRGIAGYWIKSSQESRLKSTGYWQYTQYLKVYDDVLPKITPVAADPFCSMSNDCKANVRVNFNVEEVCSADKLTVKVFLFPNGRPVPLTDANNIAAQVLSGTFPNYQLSGRYPLGNHIFEVHVKDGCGNTGVAKVPFSVVDCKAPSPICYHGVSTTLMPLEAGTDADNDGDVDEFAGVIWVSDLLRSQSSDCTTPIRYSINRVGETADRQRDHIVITCDDPDTVRVEIYAWDSANNPFALQPNGTVGGPNYDHCETYIAIRGGICPSETIPPAMITGKVQTYLGMPVSQVEIQVSGSMQMQTMTNNEGGFELNVMPHQQYFLKPHKEDDFLHGVNTEDVIILTDHIMGRKLMDNPYQLIAADIDNSGRISLMDLVLLRKAVLGMIESFPNNDSWRFIPASHVFTDPENPWSAPIPDYDEVSDMPMPIRWANFYAVKIGDLDNSIAAESGRGLSDIAYLSVDNPYLEAGQSYELSFSLPKHSSSLLGLQFEWAFDPADLVIESWAEGVLSEAFLGINRLDEGVWAVSWNSLNGEAGPGLEALFTVHIRAKRAGHVHEMIRLSQRRIKAEGYTLDRAVRPLELQFNEPQRADVRVDQNYPNPFRERTQIRFQVPEAGPVQLQIFDLHGRRVYSRLATFAAGEHYFSVTAQDLGQPGVLIYTLKANGRQDSRKMVLLP